MSRKFGMLIQDGKATLADDCAAMLDVLIKPGNVKLAVLEGHTANSFSYTLQQIYAPEKKSSGNSTYFSTEARTLIYNSFIVLQALKSLGERQMNVIDLLDVVSNLVGNEDSVMEYADLLQQHPDWTVTNSDLNNVQNYMLSMAALAQETKSSIISTAKSWLMPMIQHPKLKLWAAEEQSDFNFDEILYGKKFGVSLPESEYQQAGLAITALLKARLNTLIIGRGDAWRSKGMSEVFLIIDEAQRILDKGDQAIAAMARSLGLYYICGTQNYEGMVEIFGQDGAANMMDNFRSVVALGQISATTAEYLSKRVGKAKLWLTQIGGLAIQFGQTAKRQLSLPIFDEKNPNAFWLQRISFSSLMDMFARRGNYFFRISDGQTAHNNDQLVHWQTTQEAVPILSTNVFAKLQEQGVGLALLQNGSHPRRDVIRTQALDSKFQPIKSNVELQDEKDITRED